MLPGKGITIKLILIPLDLENLFRVIRVWQDRLFRNIISVHLCES